MEYMNCTYSFWKKGNPNLTSKNLNLFCSLCPYANNTPGGMLCRRGGGFFGSRGWAQERCGVN